MVLYRLTKKQLENTAVDKLLISLKELFHFNLKDYNLLLSTYDNMFSHICSLTASVTLGNVFLSDYYVFLWNERLLDRHKHFCFICLKF